MRGLAMQGVLGLPDDFSSCVERAAKTIRKHEFVRIVSHHDADGIAAAGIMVSSLRRAGIDSHATIVRSLGPEEIDLLSHETADCVIFLDMGAGQMDALESIGGDVLVVDHHRYVGGSSPILHVNPHLFGLDGMTEISASGLAFAVSIAMDETNWSSAPIAIAGMIGDMQHLSGYSKTNGAIVDGAAERGLVSRSNGLRLVGERLSGMIAESVNPFFKGLSGSRDSTVEFLERAGFDINAAYRELDDSSCRKLSSLLTLRLLSQGCAYETIEQISGELLTASSNGLRIDYVAELLNACGRTEHPGIGIALCLGDIGALSDASKFRSDYGRALMAGILAVERGEYETRENIRIIRPSNPALAGAICGISIQYVVPQDRPVLALTRSAGTTRVSSRGTLALVKRGLDLSESMRSASEPLGGVGGGHAVAAGATVPSSREEEFLERVDELTASQLRVADTAKGAR